MKLAEWTTALTQIQFSLGKSRIVYETRINNRFPKVCNVHQRRTASTIV